MTEFIGISLDEKFWVLIAFILFILLVAKKATKAANSTLDARSNSIKEKIDNSKNTLFEAQTLLKDSQELLANHKIEAENIIQKQKETALKNATIHLENIKNEIERKNVAAENEIQYMHFEALNIVKEKITDITLKSVEDIAITEFKNDKSNKIFDYFVENIPSGLSNSK